MHVPKTIMRTKFLFAFTLLAAAVISPAFTRAEVDNGAHFYVQPGVVFVSPGDDFKSAVGLTAAAGVAFARHHSVEVEGIFFKTESDVYWAPFELRYSIALATYKYSFRFRHGISVFAGTSIGQTTESASAKPGYVIRGDKSDDTVAYGLSGGISYSLNPNLHLEAGGRFVASDDTRFTTSGAIAILQGSMRFQF